MAVILVIIFLMVEFCSFSQKNTFLLHILPVDDNAKLEFSQIKKRIKCVDSVDVEKKLLKIRQKFIKKGYFSTNIDSICYENNIVKAYLYLGIKYLNINILPNKNDVDILREIGIKRRKISGKHISFGQFLKIREKIINYLENTGYPFAQISIDSLHFEPNQINGRLNLRKNTFIKIDSVIYKGKMRISRRYLSHYISIKSGEPYNQHKIDNLTKNLEKLPYINVHKEPEIEFRDNKADIYLYLTTKKSNYFNGIFGFQYDENENLNINGDINLSLYNNFKIGEKLDVKWNKYGKESQKIYLNTSFPYIFIFPIGITLGFSLEKYELDYLNTDFNFAFTYIFSHKNKLKGYMQHKKHLLINNNEQLTDVKETKSHIFGLKFIYDATDYFLNPHSGLYINVASGLGVRTVDEEDNQISDFKTYIAYYLPVGEISTLAFVNQSAALFSKSDLYINELYEIGGSKNLRGFDQNSISASAYSIFSVEPRLLIGKNSSVYAFFDYAYYETKTSKLNISENPFGFGAGINIDTKVGIFRLIYALGKQFDNPIKFSNSKVHFGFVARF